MVIEVTKSHFSDLLKARGEFSYACACVIYDKLQQEDDFETMEFDYDNIKYRFTEYCDFEDFVNDFRSTLEDLGYDPDNIDEDAIDELDGVYWVKSNSLLHDVAVYSILVDEYIFQYR